MAARFVSDLTIGADGTENRCGVIKIATLGETPDPIERGQFEAAAEAHRTTGAPIITHCEGGEGGMGQVETFSDLGVPLRRVVLSHTDKVTDPGYHRDLLATGVRLEYDQALRHNGPEPNPTATLVALMVEEGHADQILLGTDAARRTLWKTLGGSPGLAWLATGFAEILDGAGIDDVIRHKILVANPASMAGLGLERSRKPEGEWKSTDCRTFGSEPAPLPHATRRVLPPPGGGRYSSSVPPQGGRDPLRSSG